MTPDSRAACKCCAERAPGCEHEHLAIGPLRTSRPAATKLPPLQFAAWLPVPPRAPTLAHAEPVAQPGEVSRDDSARAILEDHMRSELDWRSYFTNRMTVQLRARSAEKHLWQEPRAASVK